jgi:gluconate 2-dehydrogenase gamma chain
MAENKVPRRSFLKGAGAAGTLAATVLTGALPRPAEAQSAPAPAAQPAPAPEPMLTLTATEGAFLSAAYDTIIPADALSPSGTDCGLVTYIDRQLAGAWGSGARMYRNGPFIPSKAEYGYQLPLSPREYFAAGIKATNAWTTKTYGKEFDRLSPADRAAALTAMEQSQAQFKGLDAKPFFEANFRSGPKHVLGFTVIRERNLDLFSRWQIFYATRLAHSVSNELGQVLNCVRQICSNVKNLAPSGRNIDRFRDYRGDVTDMRKGALLSAVPKYGHGLIL